MKKKNIKIAAGLLMTALFGSTAAFRNTAIFQNFSLTAGATALTSPETGYYDIAALGSENQIVIEDSTTEAAVGNGETKIITFEGKTITLTVIGGSITLRNFSKNDSGNVIFTVSATADTVPAVNLTSGANNIYEVSQYNSGTKEQTVTIKGNVGISVDFTATGGTTENGTIQYAAKDGTITNCPAYVNFNGFGNARYTNEGEYVIDIGTDNQETWYVADKALDSNLYCNACFVIHGTVNLILTDNANITLNGMNNFNGTPHSLRGADTNSTLNIYGQGPVNGEGGIGKITFKYLVNISNFNIYRGRVEFENGAATVDAEHMELGWTSPENYIYFGNAVTCNDVKTVSRKGFQDVDKYSNDNSMYLNKLDDTNLRSKRLAPAPLFESQSLTLGDEIGINFKMDNSALGTRTGTLKFSINGESRIATCTADNVFTCPITSIEMADKIIATYSYTNNDGKTKRFSKDYKVENYFKQYDNYSSSVSSVSKNAADLIEATANYGYFANKALRTGINTEQTKNYRNDFGYNSNEIDKIRNAVAPYAAEKGDDNFTASLILDSKTALNIFKSNGNINIDTIKVNGKTNEVRKDLAAITNSSNISGLSITGISPRMLANTYSIAEDDGTVLFTKVSPLSYVYEVLNDNSNKYDDNLKNLCCSLYEYYAAAEKHFTNPDD